jgi:hypothetical protein
MNRVASGKAAIRRAGISFNVVKKTPRTQAKTAIGIDANVVKSIRSSWRAIEAQFNRRPDQSVHVEDLLKRGLGANVVAGRQREYLAALHSELLARKKFQPVAVETKGGIGLLWRLKSQVPAPPLVSPPVTDSRYLEVELAPEVVKDLASLRETIRENDSGRRAGSYICALDYRRLMTGSLPIRRRDRAFFPSKPDPAEIILHPDRTLADVKELSGWIDGKSACIYGLSDLFQTLPIVVGSRLELTRLRLEGHYRLAIDLDAKESQPPIEPARRRVTTSFRAVARALTAGGPPLPFLRLHRLANRHRAMPPETLAAVLSDWPCFAPADLGDGVTSWRFDSSQLSAGRRSVRAARFAFEQTLSNLGRRSDALSESIEPIFKRTQVHRKELARIWPAGDQINQAGSRNSQR